MPIKHKTRSLFIIILSLIIIILTAFQWTKLKEGTIQDDHLSVEQQIEIVHDSGKLKIKQTLKNLKNHTYLLKLPEAGVNFTFPHMEFWDETNKSIAVRDNTLTVEYEINTNPDNQAFLLENWMVQISGIEKVNTIVKISELTNMAGSWAAGAPMTYHEVLDQLQYYVFERKGVDIPLYWQKAPLFYTYIGEKIPLYTDRKNDQNLLTSTIDLGLKHDKEFPAVILTEQINPLQSVSLIIENPEIDQNVLSSIWVEQFLLSNSWAGKDEEKWVMNILAGIITEQPPIDEVKAQIYAELKNKLSNNEISIFISSILQTDQKFTSLAEIDQLLGRLKGLKTSFFQDIAIEQTVSPLYFFTDEPIYVRNHKLENYRVYWMDDVYYFPIRPIIENLNYQFEQISEDEIFITNGKTTVRFYDNKDFFLINEEQYGLLTMREKLPYLKINNEFYIQKEFFRKVFRIEINHQNNQFFIR